MTSRALVTGDMGFLGRHFRRELEARGWRVGGCDVQRAIADGSLDDCRYLFNARRGTLPHYDLAIHCAAVTSSATDGQLTDAENLELDALYARWVARERPGWAVYVSSSAIYPTCLQTHRHGLRLAERDVEPDHDEFGTPDRVLGWSKLVGEVMCAQLRVLGQGVTIVRPFFGYGHDQASGSPFRVLLEQVLRREDPLRIQGDGRQVRDWVHVSDVVGATLAAVEARHDDVLNVCTGIGTSYAELARLIASETGYVQEIEYVPGEPCGVEYQVGDPDRMKTLYTPRVDLLRGVRKALREAGT